MEYTRKTAPANSSPSPSIPEITARAKEIACGTGAVVVW